jgi:hypothetical protein
MASEDENRAGSDGGSGRLGPLAGVALFAAGAGIALGAKAMLDARRKGASVTSALPLVGGREEDASRGDLPTVLRRAALDVALAATTEAADRLGSQDEAAEREPAEHTR